MSPISLPRADDVRGRVAVVREQDGSAAAIDVRDGRVRWTVNTGRSVSEGVAIVDDLVFVPGGEACCLRAIDVATGAERWRYDADGMVFGETCAVATTVLCTSLYGRAPSRLHAVDAATRKRRFVVDGAHGGALHVSVAGEAAYAALGSTLVVVDMATGATLTSVTMKNTVSSPPVVACGRLFLATTHELVMYGPDAPGE